MGSAPAVAVVDISTWVSGLHEIMVFASLSRCPSKINELRDWRRAGHRRFVERGFADTMTLVLVNGHIVKATSTVRLLLPLFITRLFHLFVAENKYRRHGIKGKMS